MIDRLVARFGRTGFAALSSVIWALPMAAWAGSADLSPIDKTAYPWIALGVGLLMLVVWFVLLTRLRGTPPVTAQHRFELAQMTGSERRWTLASIAFGTGVIGWLNGAATVDWTPLVSAVRAGKAAPSAFAAVLLLVLAALLAGLAFSWRRASFAYRRRLSAVRASLYMPNRA